MMFDFSILVLKTLIIYLMIINVVPIMNWVERRGAALIQDRPGPNRVGPFGLFQPIADFVKFLFKEDPIPREVNPTMYVLGPFMSFIPASLAIAALPIASFFNFGGKSIVIQIADIDIGLLYILAIGSLGIYGIMVGGWASNNKYSLMGSLRAASQIISYEIPLGLAAVGTVMVYGTMNLREITQLQEGHLWGVLPNWGIFYQPLGFLVFIIASFAETNRLPFDLPEAEAELVAGYHTEYGSMKFATFMMAEYMNLTTASALLVTLYFGGWHLPWISDLTLLAWTGSQNWLAVLQIVVFFTKVALFLCCFVWVRWTVPRFRFDQLIHISWRNLVPLALLNIIATAILLYWRST